MKQLNTFSIAAAFFVSDAAAQDNSQEDLAALAATAAGMAAICETSAGDIEEYGAAYAWCNARLEGFAKGLQYNCLSVANGRSPDGFLTMGDYPRVGDLRDLYVEVVRTLPNADEEPWAIVAMQIFSEAYPCQFQ